MNIGELINGGSEYQERLQEVAKFKNKWAKSGLLEGLKDGDKNQVAVLLENQGKQLFKEAAGNTTNMGSPQSYYTSGYGDQWSGIALPLVRRIFGQIMAKEFLSVQSMSMPVGLVFYLDFKYGTDKFVHKAGDSVFSLKQGSGSSTDLTQGLYGAGKGYFSANYFSASVSVTSSSVSFADVNFDANYKTTGSLVKLTVPTAGLTSHDPLAVRGFVLASGSVTENNVLQQFTKLSGSDITFIVNAAASAGTYTVYYTKETKDSQRGDFEDRADFSVPNANSATKIVIPEFKVEMKSEPISAKTRKLKAQWTWEMQQDMDKFQSIDAEQELTSLMSEYVAMEIDLELLEMLIDAAPTVEFWSAQNNSFWNGTGFDAPVSVGAGGYYNSQGEWFQTLGTKIQKVSNKIHQLTLRGGANFMITSPSISTIIESIAGYAGDTNGDQDTYNFGSQKIGTLNSRFKVYKMPYMLENLIFLGFKGSSYLESGAVYAPYIPLMSTPTVYDPETFTPNKAILTRYAKKVIRGEFYGKVYVAGLDTV